MKVPTLAEAVGKPMPRVVLGTMVLSMAELDRSFALLDAAYEAGIRVFDAAWVYAGGDAERCLGAWFDARGVRNDVVIIDKGCHPNMDRQRVTPYDLAADLHDALARLRVESIDVYMLHRDDPEVPAGEIVDALNEHHFAGRIKAFGGSNWTHARIAEANDHALARGLQPFTASSPNYGLALQVDDPWGPGCVTLSGPEHAAAREWYCETGMAVIAYSSLGRGLFSGRITRNNYREIADDACQKAYCHEVNFERLDRARALAQKKGVNVAQLALSYVLSSPMNVYATVGAVSKQECEECMAATRIELTESETRWLEYGEGRKHGLTTDL
jgi:aryl-alcohol dehydrogenase-like predicted oxidoreductase